MSYIFKNNPSILALFSDRLPKKLNYRIPKIRFYSPVTTKNIKNILSLAKLSSIYY